MSMKQELAGVGRAAVVDVEVEEGSMIPPELARLTRLCLEAHVWNGDEWWVEVIIRDLARDEQRKADEDE